MFKVVLNVTVDVSREIKILLGSMVPEGRGESKTGSNGICGGEGGRFAGREGTGGNSSKTLSDGRRLRLGLVHGVVTSSSVGAGGGVRVGRGRVFAVPTGVTPLSTSSSGSGGKGGLLAR